MRFTLALTLGGLFALTAATAAAEDWTSAIAIRTLEVPHQGDGYRLYTEATITPGGGGCQTDYYETQSSSPTATKELIARTLLSAYLAGQKVKIMSSNSVCGPSGRRTIAGVRVSVNY